MKNPENFYYTETHEWVKRDGGELLVGITDFAQEELGEIVYVELPEIGAALEAGEECGMIDSAKTSSPIMNPVTGTVTRVNEELIDHPELVNKSPYIDGWMYAIEPDNPGDVETLMESAEYGKFVESDGH